MNKPVIILQLGEDRCLMHTTMKLQSQKELFILKKLIILSSLSKKEKIEQEFLVDIMVKAFVWYLEIMF